MQQQKCSYLYDSKVANEFLTYTKTVMHLFLDCQAVKLLLTLTEAENEFSAQINIAFNYYEKIQKI